MPQPPHLLGLQIYAITMWLPIIIIIITVLAIKPRSLHMYSTTEIHPTHLILINNLG